MLDKLTIFYPIVKVDGIRIDHDWGISCRFPGDAPTLEQTRDMALRRNDAALALEQANRPGQTVTVELAED